MMRGTRTDPQAFRAARHLRGCRSATWCAAGLLLCASLAGCASLPSPVLIALPAVPSSTRPAPMLHGAPAPVLLVHRLVIPEYMAARPVRYWAGAATLAEWPNAYWAERVEVGMAREFVAALRDRLPGWTIWDTNCDAGCGVTLPELTLSVALLRLDAVRRDLRLVAHAESGLVVAASGQRPAQLLATWVGTFDLALPTDSAAGEALALRDLLAALADASAREIRFVHPMPPPSGRD